MSYALSLATLDDGLINTVKSVLLKKHRELTYPVMDIPPILTLQAVGLNYCRHIAVSIEYIEHRQLTKAQHSSSFYNY